MIADFGIVYVTASSQAEAEMIADALVSGGLAACVSIFPIQSVYIWQQEICRESEWQLLIKTRRDQYPALEAKVKTLHSFTTPEIIFVPIATGCPAYLEWMHTQTSSSQP
jgi:periplasmic divalent cation tolerance protein